MYNDDFKITLNPEFKEKLMMEGMAPADVEILSDPNFKNVSKLAIDNSDAIIKGTEIINDEVDKYIQSSGKLFLDFQPKESYIEAYNNFYEKVW